jgi:hypothetical protein
MPRRKGHAVLFGDAHVEHTIPGKRCAMMSTPVPEGMAAVTATTFGSRAASSVSALPNTEV